MPDEFEPSWLAGLPEEPEPAESPEALKVPEARPKRQKPQPATPTKTKYEPFHW